MANESVPVKTKYPTRPPASEPLRVHQDWLGTTAANLAQNWLGLSERRESWAKLRRAGADDPVIRHELEQWQKLSEEVLPLFAETVAYVPREIWGSFEHIRTLYNAGKSPTLAVNEWKKLRDYCWEQLAKPAPQSTGGGGADGEWSLPMSKTDMRVRLGNLPQRKFKTFTITYPLKPAGNRQLFQIRLDGMDAATRKKLEKP